MANEKNSKVEMTSIRLMQGSIILCAFMISISTFISWGVATWLTVTGFSIPLATLACLSFHDG